MTALNHAIDDTETDYETRKFLTATIGHQMMGIDAIDVRDVIRRQDMTAVPMSDGRIEGILNLRGHIVTVLNVRRCLGLAEGDPETTSQMCIVIEQGKELFGLLVDQVRDVLDLKQTEIEPNPATLDATWQDAAKGVFCLDKDILIILDVAKMVNSLKDER